MSDTTEDLVGTRDAWHHNAALHNAMRREIGRVATYAAAHERTHEWISDRLTEILDDPVAWMEPVPRTWSLPAEPGPEVTAVRDASDDEGVSFRRDDHPQRPWVDAADDSEAPYRLSWGQLLLRYGPLTDASAEVTP